MNALHCENLWHFLPKVSPAMPLLLPAADPPRVAESQPTSLGATNVIVETSCFDITTAPRSGPFCRCHGSPSSVAGYAGRVFKWQILPFEFLPTTPPAVRSVSPNVCCPTPAPHPAIPENGIAH